MVEKRAIRPTGQPSGSLGSHSNQGLNHSFTATPWYKGIYLSSSLVGIKTRLSARIRSSLAVDEEQ